MKGHICARGKNTWRLFADLHRDPSEPRKQITTTFHGTRGAAQVELRRLLGQIDAGLRHDSRAETVGAFLRRWLDTVVSVSVTAATFEKYEGIVEMHLTPALGAIKLRDLKASHIQALYSAWRLNGRKGDNTRPLSPSTVRKHHAVLHRALQTARRWKLVSENVAGDVDLPRADPSNERVFLSAADCGKLLDASLDSRLAVPVLLMLETGLRRGELLALKWSDVEYENRRLIVRRAVERTKAFGMKLKETKNGRVRVVTLSDGAITALRGHWEAQRLEEIVCIKQAGSYDAQGLVFPMPWGSMWDPHAFGVAFRRLAKAALGELRGNIGPHKLRHAAASLMLQQGLGPKVVADRLGHTTTRMTLDVYAHVAPELEARAADAVAAAIRAVTNPLPNRAELEAEDLIGTAQSLAPQGLPMVGARGLEPLTPTVSM